MAWTLLLVGEHNGIVGKAGHTFENHPEHYSRVDVYTTPQQRTWVELTKDELVTLFEKYGHKTGELVGAVEDKLKEKNT